MNEKKLKKILEKWFSDCTVDVVLMQDDDFEFSYYSVFVYTKCAFPLSCFYDIEKSIKEVFDLDCCEYKIDLGRCFFTFDMF